MARRRALPAVDHVHRAGLQFAAHSLVGNTDRQVVRPIPVEVAGGDGSTKVIGALSDTQNVGTVPVPEFVRVAASARVGKTRGTAIREQRASSPERD